MASNAPAGQREGESSDQAPRRDRIELSPLPPEANPADPGFEILLKDLAVGFVSTSAMEVDAEIDRWLGRITSFFGADRSSISQRTPTGFSVTHCWAREPKHLPTLGRDERTFPHIAAAIGRGEPYLFPHVDDIPPDHFEERESVRTEGIKSHVSVPMVVAGQIVGVMSVSFMRSECPWVAGISRRIELVVTVIGNALARKTEAAERRMTARALAHAERIATLGQLASSFAHELNQPLAASLTNSDSALRLLDRNPPDLAEVREALVDIAADMRRAGDIVRELRGYLRRQNMKVEAVDLGRFATSVTRFLLPEARRRGVDLRIDVASGPWSAAVDRIQLQQALVNLALNAFQALEGAPAGRRRVTLTFGAPVEGRFPLSVADNGPGVPESMRASLFAPFATTKPEGIGLGLPICRNIAEAHGGTLEYTPSPTGGAVFSFSVPVATGPAHGR